MTSSCVIPVSLGELFDKYTILQIKQTRIVNQAKLEYINAEIAYLEPYILRYAPDPDMLASLRVINETLWDIENRIRQKEDAGEFDAEFIDLARRVYLTNDKRYSVKNRINETLGSDIKEIKHYV